MAVEETYQKVLEHLKKKGQLNTFQLATNLNLDRYKLLNLIEKLEKAGAVEVQHGLVKFLKFAVEGKKVEKPVEVKKTVSKQKKKVVQKRKKVKKKPVTPKVQVENEELKERILQLESKVEELERKASIPPKIIKRTIIKKIPVPSAPAHIPSKKKRKKKRKARRKKKIKKEGKPEKVQKKSKKFRFIKFTFMKNIKQLKKPEFAKK